MVRSVDLMWFLRDKLGFIQRLYDLASEPFTTKMKKIENGETPFDVYGNADPESDEPPFLSEWIEASESADIVGNCCLCLVQSALKQFLEAFMQETGQKPPAGKLDWFKRYRAFFMDTYGIVWEDGPVKIAVLEDLNLARNDIQHEGSLMVKHMIQSKNSAERFPDSIFAETFVVRKKIAVNRDSLLAAIQAVDGFCEYLQREQFGS